MLNILIFQVLTLFGTMLEKKIIIVAGPTASGKSALAEKLALRHNGLLINADASQIYEGLPILTNQPRVDLTSPLKDRYRLYGVINPSERSSVGEWLMRVEETLLEADDKNLTPILIGGTGLYLKAFLDGIHELPSIPPHLHDEITSLYQSLGEKEFRDILSTIDPEVEKRIAKNDRQRLIRAYEIYRVSGESLSSWYQKPSQKKRDLNLIEPYLLMPNREGLYAACNHRFQNMMHEGAMEEVKLFLERELNPLLPSMKTIGVRELSAHLRDECTLDKAIADAQQATRNYAKRQMTWFRNQWPFAAEPVKC